MLSLPIDDQIVVVNAHPRIGAPKQSLSEMSRMEQGYDANKVSPAPPVDQLEVDKILAQLNAEYENKFGFKFVVFVAGRPRSMIPAIIKDRMKNDREAELRAGLSAMIEIARDRLKKLSSSSL
ncbi:hypothetical protein HDU76_004066 [Blyttiomyces sp. JEL0837]|nr:hypothetical protein HDU76_004066 [Blyttiomyces sp. JEL0837]